MTHTELKQKFEVADKTARDFIRWAAEKGVKVHDATISRHLSGKQGITQAWELALSLSYHSRKDKSNGSQLQITRSQ